MRFRWVVRKWGCILPVRTILRRVMQGERTRGLGVWSGTIYPFPALGLADVRADGGGRFGFPVLVRRYFPLGYAAFLRRHRMREGARVVRTLRMGARGGKRAR